LLGAHLTTCGFCYAIDYLAPSWRKVCALPYLVA
jgi:hypothetical protein